MKPFRPLIIVLPLLLCSCGHSFVTLYHGERDARLIRFGAEINSPYDDFAPVLLPGGAILLLTSNRPHAGGSGGNCDLYRSRLEGERWGAVERVDVSREEDLNEGALAFDDTRHEVVFQQCYVPGGYGDCDLYIATVRNGSWEGIRNAGPNVNSRDWDAHPTLTRDGNTLYFSSERYGGRGGADIWVTTRRPDGSWNPAENVGPPVNTPGDEKSPFISPDGRYLYFASDYLDGFGGLDIFRSEKTGTGWSTPVNLGAPVNSEGDDLFFTATANEDTCFVSSNRSGSLGGLDVYQIIRFVPAPPPPPPEKPMPLVLKMTVLNEFTMKPVVATILLTSPPREETTLETDAGGYAGHEVQGGAEYAITTLAPGFLTGHDSFKSEPGATGEERRTILLKPIREDERVIYKFRVEFDFDKFHIRPEERKHLDSAAVLLTRFPKSTVVVAGHTDGVGSVQYNMILGWNRASRVSEYVNSYMTEKQVHLLTPPEVRSYGKSQPVDTNETDEGRQRNRRVEIMIVRNE